MNRKITPTPHLSTVNPSTIPIELKVRAQWVVWREEPRGTGKMAKVPIDPKTGCKASVTDPSTWGTFDQAMAYYSQFKDRGCCGIGYVFTDDDPFTGVDLDKCRDAVTGEIEHWALEVVKKLSSYTERSPSHTGLHVIVMGGLPPGPRRKGRIEAYNSGRYFTMTGHVLSGCLSAIEYRQKELDEIVAGFLGGTQNASSQLHKAHGSHLTASTGTETLGWQAFLGRLEEAELTSEDEEILHRLKSSQEGKIYQLLVLGYWEEAGACRKNGPYDSISEADQALMNKLARLTSGDAGRMKAIFLETGLARVKIYEHPTYLVRTIQKALAGLGWRPAHQTTTREEA